MLEFPKKSSKKFKKIPLSTEDGILEGKRVMGESATYWLVT